MTPWDCEIGETQLSGVRNCDMTLVLSIVRRAEGSDSLHLSLASLQLTTKCKLYITLQYIQYSTVDSNYGTVQWTAITVQCSAVDSKYITLQYSGQ